MKISNRPIATTCAAIMGAALLYSITGCGIEGGGSAIADQTPVLVTSGIEGGGSVRRFSAASNTLTVGSKQLDVSSAMLVVTIDGQDASLQQLRIGDQVTFSGLTSDDGQSIEATSIEQDDLVEGPIDSGTINPSEGTFQVLGQLIVVDELTIFSSEITPNDINGLADGDFLEISGISNANGVIEASRIELELNDSDFEVTGVINTVDTLTMTLTINNLTVDYASAELEGFGENEPAVGDRIEVEGSMLVNGLLIAEEVELVADFFSGDDGEFGVIEGLITSVSSAMNFAVNDQPVRVGDDTEFENGTIADLAIGRRVEVEGSLDAEGTLMATEVEFEDEQQANVFGLEGVVESINSTDESLVIMGVTVQVLLTTRLEGEDDRPLEFSDIAIGTILEVDGSVATDAPDILLAAKIEIEDDSDEAGVTGPISQIMEPMFSVFGVNVLTNNDTDFEGDLFSSSAEFFLTISTGSFVEIEGSFDGSVLTATSVEAGDDD